MANFFEIPSVLREEEHNIFSSIELSGSVLDIGGDKNSSYQSLFKGDYKLITINFDAKTTPDIIHDLEKPLPIESSAYDGVLLINILEHVFNYRELLAEAFRVIKPGGRFVAAVPFLFPIHPSPRDYYRFTEEALLKECARLGLEQVKITPLGEGVFSARYLMLERLFPWPIRMIYKFSVRYLARVFDALFNFLARALKKKYNRVHYALGYCLTAKKPISAIRS